MRILLTGAAGFIGSHVRSALMDRGHEVVAVDAMLGSAHGTGASPPTAVGLLDIRDPDAVERALRGIDVVCHQAAVVGAGVDTDDAPAYASHNDYGTAVLLAAMHRARCRRLVLASSMVVYGEGLYRCPRHGRVVPGPRLRSDLDRGIFDSRCPDGGEPLSWEPVDEDAPLQPRSFYAASKLAQEKYALAWSLTLGASVTALRYHNVYGDLMPRDTPYSGVAALFRSALESGRAPCVFEDGRQTRDFVHVRDVAEANARAVEAQLDGFIPINVCSGRPLTIGEVARTLARAHGGRTPVVTGEYRPGDVRHIVADPGRAVHLLGFRATIAPDEGLSRFVREPMRRAVPAGPPSV
ncbi:NAD-dependent epimerase/dehydratase family protein [Speluncibacter jeojiensis]|uniref:NAD-dependent epimerase/dehydratase family protein n=1 Tax=Speluncibacter jeojiensis TaxID=2710754 RepID=A0A9X4LX52_9ACTN|nr:NAD-dependent epimerase/dehydratase family protein [Corynebacteriales bacterium D3-21]